jgi:hypothetical protein
VRQPEAAGQKVRDIRQINKERWIVEKVGVEVAAEEIEAEYGGHNLSLIGMKEYQRSGEGSPQRKPTMRTHKASANNKSGSQARASNEYSGTSLVGCSAARRCPG